MKTFNNWTIQMKKQLNLVFISLYKTLTAHTIGKGNCQSTSQIVVSWSPQVDSMNVKPTTTTPYVAVIILQHMIYITSSSSNSNK